MATNYAQKPQTGCKLFQTLILDNSGSESTFRQRGVKTKEECKQTRHVLAAKVILIGIAVIVMILTKFRAIL